jgi:hypothetical protein
LSLYIEDVDVGVHPGGTIKATVKHAEVTDKALHRQHQQTVEDARQAAFKSWQQALADLKTTPEAQAVAALEARLTGLGLKIDATRKTLAKTAAEWEKAVDDDAPNAGQLFTAKRKAADQLAANISAQTRLKQQLVEAEAQLAEVRSTRLEQARHALLAESRQRLDAALEALGRAVIDKALAIDVEDELRGLLTRGAFVSHLPQQERADVAQLGGRGSHSLRPAVPVEKTDFRSLDDALANLDRERAEREQARLDGRDYDVDRLKATADTSVERAARSRRQAQATSPSQGMLDSLAESMHENTAPRRRPPVAASGHPKPLLSADDLKALKAEIAYDRP